MMKLLTALLILASTPTFATEIRVSETYIEQHLKALAKIGNLGSNPSDGFTRNAWSNEESKAIEYIKNEGIKIGLTPRYDAVGNLFLKTSNNAKKVILTGSHLDTVTAGGNYDGAAGVVASLEAIRSIIQKGLPNSTDLELVVWRGEESTSYGTAYKGSKLAFKEKISNKELDRVIKQQGFKGVSAINNTPNHYAYFELHIEQGNKLELDRKEIGIVTSIRGADRYKIKVYGKFDHSGATPMGTGYRQDANLAIAHIQVALDNLIKQYTEKGYDLVQTVGVVNSDRSTNDKEHLVYNNAQTKVSGFGYFIIDIRSNNKKQKAEYVKAVLSNIKSVAKSFKTKVEIDHVSESAPAETLDKKLQDNIEQATKALNYKYEFMPSGAGHDAAIVAKHKTPSAMIFIPCKDGTSHSKEEFAKTSDIKKGTEVLANAIWNTIN